MAQRHLTEWNRLVAEERAQGHSFREALMRAKTRYHREGGEHHTEHHHNPDMHITRGWLLAGVVVGALLIASHVAATSAPAPQGVTLPGGV